MQSLTWRGSGRKLPHGKGLKVKIRFILQTINAQAPIETVGHPPSPIFGKYE